MCGIIGEIQKTNQVDLEQFDSLIDNMNNTQSKFMIIKALEYSFEKGVFSLKESEIVSKCIRDLNKM